MNKTVFIKKLAEKTGLDEEKCSKINEVLESHNFMSGKGKDEILNELKEKLHLSDEMVDKVYNAAMKIIGGSLLDKLKNPFKSQD